MLRLIRCPPNPLASHVPMLHSSAGHFEVIRKRFSHMLLSQIWALMLIAKPLQEWQEVRGPAADTMILDFEGPGNSDHHCL